VELGFGDVKLVLASVGCNMLVISWGFLFEVCRSPLCLALRTVVFAPVEVVGLVVPL
jgi:hypothetical protein